MVAKLKSYVSNKWVLLTLYSLFAVIAGIQSLIGTKTYEDGGIEYNHYNNYTIFEKSYHHLKSNQDLYVLYPQEHWDLFKYTPSFSAFFGIFSILPDWLGLNLWNLLNALVLLLAVYSLPRLDDTKKGWISLILLIELMTSMQNEQSNALIAGLIILTYSWLERGNQMAAALCVVTSVFIKLFGIVGFALFLFYPKKWKSALYTAFWTLFLLALPLLFVDLPQYSTLLKSYFNLLKNDHDSSYGYSVMGWLHTWFSLELPKNAVVAVGVLIFLLPFCKLRMYRTHEFKYLLLCSILIWIVIFNHKAESPTFIIAMAGVALWFVFSEKNSVNVLLFVSAFVLTSLLPTDIFPTSIRNAYVKPFVLKAIPCILIWFKIIFDMMMLKAEKQPFLERGNARASS